MKLVGGRLGTRKLFELGNRNRVSPEKEISHLKLVQFPLSLAASLAALPSISEIPFLDSCFHGFQIEILCLPVLKA